MNREVARVREDIAEALRFRMYIPMIIMKDRKLYERIKMIIMNENSRTVSNGKMILEFTIPSNALLAEVAVTPEEAFELEMLDNGKARIVMELAAMSPSEEFEMEVDIYFAGVMTSPSYTLDSEAVLLVDELETDAVGMDAVLKVEAAAAAL